MAWADRDVCSLSLFISKHPTGNWMTLIFLYSQLIQCSDGDLSVLTPPNKLRCLCCRPSDDNETLFWYAHYQITLVGLTNLIVNQNHRVLRRHSLFYTKSSDTWLFWKSHIFYIFCLLTTSISPDVIYGMDSLQKCFQLWVGGTEHFKYMISQGIPNIFLCTNKRVQKRWERLGTILFIQRRICFVKYLATKIYCKSFSDSIRIAWVRCTNKIVCKYLSTRSYLHGSC